MSCAGRVYARGILGFLAVFVPFLIAASPASAALFVNEVESQAPGDGPDYIELYNDDASAANIGNLVAVKDSNNANSFTIAPGTTIPATGFYTVFPDVGGGFALGSSDQARLYEADGTTLIDGGYTWTSHAPTTYGRCPDGSGAFATTSVGTEGAANDCSTLNAWPGGSSVSTADSGVLGEDVSGLAFEPSGSSAPTVLYAVEQLRHTLPPDQEWLELGP